MTSEQQPELSIQQRRLVCVLERMIKQVKEDGQGDVEMYSDALDEMLDKLNESDGFGTEGQTDPRGDFRNGNWHIEHVEGIDVVDAPVPDDVADTDKD